MRKTILGASAGAPHTAVKNQALNVSNIASVEVTSEDEHFPVDGLFGGDEGVGWRAAGPGKQLIRILFDLPTSMKRIELTFQERGMNRTQEFSLRWVAPSGDTHEIVRQQWNFSPSGSMTESEAYDVALDELAVLEIEITPDIGGKGAIASLASLRLFT